MRSSFRNKHNYEWGREHFLKNTEKGMSELGPLLSFFVVSLSLILRNPGALEEREHIFHSELSKEKCMVFHGVI